MHQGFILNGFPFNVRQALMLDHYIKGINLAIYFRNENKSHEQSIAELLDYYDQRVPTLIDAGQPRDMELKRQTHRSSNSQAVAIAALQH